MTTLKGRRFLKKSPKVLGGYYGGEGNTGARNGQGEDLRIGQGDWYGQ